MDTQVKRVGFCVALEVDKERLKHAALRNTLVDLPAFLGVMKHDV